MNAEEFNRAYPLYTRVWYVMPEGSRYPRFGTTVQGEAWDEGEETFVALHGVKKANIKKITKFDKE